MGTLFWFIVGLAIGWNFPQPFWARAVQNVVVNWWNNLWANK